MHSPLPISIGLGHTKICFLWAQPPSWQVPIPAGAFEPCPIRLTRREKHAYQIRRLVHAPELAGDHVDPIKVRIEPEDFDLGRSRQDFAERAKPLDVFIIDFQHDHRWSCLADFRKTIRIPAVHKLEIDPIQVLAQPGSDTLGEHRMGR